MKKVICGLGVAVLLGASAVTAEVVEPQDLGIVEAPGVGSRPLDLEEVPKHILHTAKVAFKEYDGGAFLSRAQLDMDEILAIYEIQGQTRDGDHLEADVKPDGVLVELEVEIGMDKVPQNVLDAKSNLFPNFAPADETPLIEKSIRPSEGGLSEIWYEFSGAGFDVEVRSDGKALLAEPA
ncbi:MAG: hypothetical protein ACREV3_11350 [Gammaproteobacteria bacterium]